MKIPLAYLQAYISGGMYSGTCVRRHLWSKSEPPVLGRVIREWESIITCAEIHSMHSDYTTGDMSNLRPGDPRCIVHASPIEDIPNIL